MTTKLPIRTVYDASNEPIGLSEFQVGEFLPISVGGTGGNTVATARTTLGVDNSNIRSLFSVSGTGSYDNTTGIITVTGGVTSVGGATGTISNIQIASSITQSGLLTTANVAELTNLYFTNARVYSNVTSIGYATNANVALKANLSDKLNVFAATSSSELASILSDETGSGALVFATSPTLVTPALGTPSSGTLTNATGLPIVDGTTGTLSVARGGTGVTGSTGTGNVVLSVSPTFTGNVSVVGGSFSGSGSLLTNLPSVGFLNTTTSDFSLPTGDYGNLTDIIRDAFDIATSANYDCMDPVGRMINTDFGVLT